MRAHAHVLFYFDESGSRDPSNGAAERPEDHHYVLLCVGVYEGQWPHFETAISRLKLEPADCLERAGQCCFELADCEVKSNWMRIRAQREKRNPFLHGPGPGDRTHLADMWFRRIADRNTTILAGVIGKRFTHEALHMMAYESCWSEYSTIRGTTRSTGR